MKTEFKVSYKVQSRRTEPQLGSRGKLARSTSRGHGKWMDQFREEQQVQHKRCSFCDQPHAFGNKEDRSAFGKQCLKCGRKDHFAVCCRGGHLHTSRGQGHWRGA